MIRLQSIALRNFRGILDLDVSLEGRSFAIQGPNGSGKSGVVDAIEFALTGNISRLSGPGTAGLTVARHGPHVDFDSAQSEVTLSVILPDNKTLASIKRSPHRPRAPVITPDNTDTQRLFAYLEKHPEFVLSRRQIIRYILTEAGKRREEIQSLLKMERVERFRASLKTASTTLARELVAADSSRQAFETALKTALSVPDISDATVLAETNRIRALAGVQALSDLGPAARLDADVVPESPETPSAVSRRAVLADLSTFRNLYNEDLLRIAEADLSAFTESVSELRADPSLLAEVEREQFLDMGLQFFDDQFCPFCDTQWDAAALRQLVNEKLGRLARGKQLKRNLIALAAPVLARLQSLELPLKSLAAASRTLNTTGHQQLTAATSSIGLIKMALSSSAQFLSFESQPLSVITDAAPLEAALASLDTAASALPDESARAGATALLLQAQPRFVDVRQSLKTHAAAKEAAERASLALTLFDQTAEDVLNALYGQVQANFVTYYRFIHQDDESAFSAELKREAASVELGVDFYGRGHFPPAAYHSEGHQDGMGLCLYLALMRQVLGRSFTFAVLDDVVMSVDSAHRRGVCRLLKEHFPETQFILTTHDKVWLGQLHSTGVVRKRDALQFTNWSVDRGPLLRARIEVWDDIDAKLRLDEVNDAAGTLRRHLEEVSFDLADQLRAPVPLRADSGYMLSDLLPGVTSRWKELLGKAIAAAHSWGLIELQASLLERKATFQDVLAASNIEQWALNPAVHYNQWENFSREDFSPVVAAFKALLKCFRCPQCDLWLYAEPAIPSPESVRCPCGAGSMNLALKPKEPS